MVRDWVSPSGDGVAPAVPGANTRRWRLCRANSREMQLRAASYHTDKPQDNNKGVKTLSGMSNVPLLKKVQEKFKDYRILDMSENGDHICAQCQRPPLHLCQ